MSAAAKENCILRKELAAALDRNTDPECIAAVLAGVAGSMGGQLPNLHGKEECAVDLPALRAAWVGN